MSKLDVEIIFTSQILKAILQLFDNIPHFIRRYNGGKYMFDIMFDNNVESNYVEMLCIAYIILHFEQGLLPEIRRYVLYLCRTMHYMKFVDFNVEEIDTYTTIEQFDELCYCIFVILNGERLVSHMWRLILVTIDPRYIPLSRSTKEVLEMQYKLRNIYDMSTIAHIMFNDSLSTISEIIDRNNVEQCDGRYVKIDGYYLDEHNLLNFS